jgi:hypothetical protein
MRRVKFNLFGPVLYPAEMLLALKTVHISSRLTNPENKFRGLAYAKPFELPAYAACPETAPVAPLCRALPIDATRLCSLRHCSLQYLPQGQFLKPITIMFNMARSRVFTAASRAVKVSLPCSIKACVEPGKQELTMRDRPLQ